MSTVSAMVRAQPCEGDEPPRRLRRSTVTSRFGSSRRESHDASGFYERFVAPEQSSDATVVAPAERDVLVVGDARHMQRVHDNSVALGSSDS